MAEQNELWVIRRIDNGQTLKTRSGKQAWRKPGHAKNAWNQWREYGSLLESFAKNIGVELVPTGYKGKLQFPRFDEQNVYELVDVMKEGRELKEEVFDFVRFVQGRTEDRQIEEMATDLLQRMEEQEKKV